MNVDDAMSQMMNNHQKTAKKASKSKKTKKIVSKRVPEPTEPLDPENEKIRPTLIKVCAYLEWMKQEIREIREELEAKTDHVEHNSLSLKVDQVDTVVTDLSLRLDEMD
jgi:myo-inositol-1-phosphate synthase